jgi:hypothetical protein
LGFSKFINPALNFYRAGFFHKNIPFQTCKSAIITSAISDLPHSQLTTHNKESLLKTTGFIIGVQ